MITFEDGKPTKWICESSRWIAGTAETDGALVDLLSKRFEEARRNVLEYLSEQGIDASRGTFEIKVRFEGWAPAAPPPAVEEKEG